ncbi:hypothetical protein C8Q76DRAFT_709959 [Earliella scabrosa]|nr:hypothetical protein C8Q76DRAFT_709959 [Earliella scabrosa]
MLFAAIRTPIPVSFPPESGIIDINKLQLPNEHEILSKDMPIVPQDPTAIYKMVEEAHKLDKSQRTSSSSTNDSGGSPTNSQDEPDQPARMVMEWKTIGVVYVTTSSIPGEVHVGVALLPAYRGHGGGMKACAFAVQWAVETIQAHRVQARIMSSPHRDRAQRLFTALGFAYEGLQRRAVPDATGAWADITHLGAIDTDWLVRRRVRAAPRSMWDELFARHQREREELLRWDERRERMRLHRTSSTETIRMATQDEMEYDSEPADAEFAFSDDSSSCSQSRFPSRAPTISPRSTSPPNVPSDFEDALEMGDEQVSWRSPLFRSDVEDPFSDSEWVMSSALSDGSRSSEEPLSRPLSAASWSSFESVGPGTSSAALQDQLRELGVAGARSISHTTGS